MSQQDSERSLTTAATMFLMENIPVRAALACSTVICQPEIN